MATYKDDPHPRQRAVALLAEATWLLTDSRDWAAWSRVKEAYGILKAEHTAALAERRWERIMDVTEE